MGFQSLSKVPSEQSSRIIIISIKKKDTYELIAVHMQETKTRKKLQST